MSGHVSSVMIQSMLGGADDAGKVQLISKRSIKVVAPPPIIFGKFRLEKCAALRYDVQQARLKDGKLRNNLRIVTVFILIFVYSFTNPSTSSRTMRSRASKSLSFIWTFLKVMFLPCRM